MTVLIKKLKTSYPKIEDIGGSVKKVRRLTDPDDKLWSAFNPSIGYSPELGYAMTIRSSNYVITLDTGYLALTCEKEVRTRLWFCELDENLNLLNLREVKIDSKELKIVRGVEDAKLFWRDGSWWFTAIMLEKEHTPFARVSLFKYDHKKNVATFIKKYAGPEFNKPEKNWMLPYEPNPNFDFIYGPASIIKDDVFIKYPNLNWDITSIRGNTNLLKIDNEYLGVVHTLYAKQVIWNNPNTFAKQEGLKKVYTHRFAKYNYKGELTHLSSEFQFEHHGIEFACGIVEKDDNFVISYGKDDLSSHFAFIPKSIALGGLRELENR
jgi:hypothetical protein